MYYNGRFYFNSLYRTCRMMAVNEGQHEQENGLAISYEDLETAAFSNNQEFIQDWLRSQQDDQLQWRGRLLSRAAYHHSVDAVRCIIASGNSGGWSVAISMLSCHAYV